MSVCISVVIPTYRRPDLLKKCLFALAKQDFPCSQFEIIVVTDGPDGATMDLIISQRISRKSDLLYLNQGASRFQMAQMVLGCLGIGSDKEDIVWYFPLCNALINRKQAWVGKVTWRIFE